MEQDTTITEIIQRRRQAREGHRSMTFFQKCELGLQMGKDETILRNRYGLTDDDLKILYRIMDDLDCSRIL